MKPTVGRIVHFYDHTIAKATDSDVGAGPYAAIITEVRDDDTVCLQVMHISVMPYHRDVPQDKDGSADQPLQYWVEPPRGAGVSVQAPTMAFDDPGGAS